MTSKEKRVQEAYKYESKVLKYHWKRPKENAKAEAFDFRCESWFANMPERGYRR